MSLRPFSQFSVPDRSEEVGMRGRLSKWQWALVLGIPLAAAAALAGLVLVIRRRRRRDTLSQESPQASMNTTPIASPISTSSAKRIVTDGKERVSFAPVREQHSVYLLQ